MHSSLDTCEQLRAAADELRRQAVRSRRAIDQSRQLQADVQVQELRVMKATREASVTGTDVHPVEHRGEENE